jgi:hypothetical protein
VTAALHCAIKSCSFAHLLRLTTMVSCWHPSVTALHRLVSCRQRLEDAQAAEVLDIRQAHNVEMQQQAVAHAALCEELHARADADAAAAAKLAADAGASQQVDVGSE